MFRNIKKTWKVPQTKSKSTKKVKNFQLTGIKWNLPNRPHSNPLPKRKIPNLVIDEARSLPLDFYDPLESMSSTTSDEFQDWKVIEDGDNPVGNEIEIARSITSTENGPTDVSRELESFCTDTQENNTEQYTSDDKLNKIYNDHTEILLTEQKINCHEENNDNELEFDSNLLGKPNLPSKQISLDSKMKLFYAKMNSLNICKTKKQDDFSKHACAAYEGPISVNESNEIELEKTISRDVEEAECSQLSDLSEFYSNSDMESDAEQESCQELQEIVDDRIKDSVNCGFLDLSATNLPFFPLAILSANTEMIRRLSLQDNKIVSIPGAALQQLISLTWLDLRYNLLESLPSEIGQLENLKVLLLQENFLRCLPTSLGNINLDILQLSGNPLEFPPKDVVSLGVSHILEYLNEKEISIRMNDKKERDDEKEETLSQCSEIDLEDYIIKESKLTLIGTEKSDSNYEERECESMLGSATLLEGKDTSEDELLITEGSEERSASDCSFCTCSKEEYSSSEILNGSLLHNDKWGQNISSKRGSRFCERSKENVIQERSKKSLHLIIQQVDGDEISKNYYPNTCKNCGLPVQIFQKEQKKKVAHISVIEIELSKSQEIEYLKKKKEPLKKAKLKQPRKRKEKFATEDSIHREAEEEYKRRKLIEAANRELHQLKLLKSTMGLDEWRENAKKLQKDSGLMKKKCKLPALRPPYAIQNDSEYIERTKYPPLVEVIGELQFCSDRLSQIDRNGSSLKEIKSIMESLSAVRKSLKNASQVQL